VFFKSKIKPDDFANCLLRDHQAIFGRSRLDHICEQFDFHFRDEPSYIEAFYELQAFGLYSIASGVRTRCGQDLRTLILASLNERFADISGPNWKMMCQCVTEYQEFGNSGPTGGLASQRIFDRPPGAIQPNSQDAFGLMAVMNASYLDAVEAVQNLFKQYKFESLGKKCCMNFEELKAEESRILAEYAERYRPQPYRQIFYSPVSGTWKVDALYVGGFFEAAKFLLEGIVAGKLPESLHGVAAVYLSRHYLELEIKYALFHSRWLKHERCNTLVSEVVPVTHAHMLQPLWDKLKTELKARVPSSLTSGLDLKFVAQFVAEFHKVDKSGWRFRYPKATIAAVVSPALPTSILGIDFESLLFTLNRAHEILDTLDGRLVDQHGENEEWQGDLDSL
jgi:hypothetical protein